MSSDLKLLVTIDVEEEGLFNGQYRSGKASVENVTKLSLLDPIFEKLSIRPTLLVSYQVASHKPHQEYLMQLCEKWKGEIGAHLHPWNTPPLQSLPFTHPVPSQLIPKELLKEKLDTLLQTLSQMGVKPHSFRMGRFSLGPKMFSLLEQSEIKVDSSIVPTRKTYGGPEYLVAPVDPYFPDPQDLSASGNSSLLEVPLTVLPIVPGITNFLEKISNAYPASSSIAAWFSQYLGSIPAQPMAVGLNRMKTAVRIHRYRGGNVVVIYFHSSELMPGCSPQHPTQKHVERFLAKMERFLSWVIDDLGVESVTLSGLRNSYFF